jgi:DHA2 family multidrug resistance protein-like MFS transporter
MGVLLAVGPFLLPEYRDPDAGRPDVISAALSVCAVLAVIFGLKQIAQDGLAVGAALAMIVGLAAGLAFVARQLRLRDPLIDLRLFRVPAFSGSVAAHGLGFFVLLGGFLFLPQYLQLVLGLSPLAAGLWSAPWACAFIVGSQATPILVRRYSPATLMAAGLVLAAIGFGMFTQINSESGLAIVVVGSVAFSLGLAPVFTLATDLVVGSASPERAGAASAISETSSELGGALGIAIFGSIGIAVYRSAFALPLFIDLPPETVDAARATLGTAVAVAEHLPGERGVVLVEAARAAFVGALQLTAGLSAVGSLGIAALVMAVLRGVDPQEEEDTGRNQPHTSSAAAPSPSIPCGGGTPYATPVRTMMASFAGEP